MEAQKFIDSYGIQKAKDAIMFVPESKHWFSLVMVKANGFLVEMDAPTLRHEEGGEYTSTFKLCDEWSEKFTKIKDLKLLVADIESTQSQTTKKSLDY